jgi:hypothetical protein
MSAINPLQRPMPLQPPKPVNRPKPVSPKPAQPIKGNGHSC